MSDKHRNAMVTLIGIAACLFTLFEVNYNRLQPQSARALFALFGLAACFLMPRSRGRFKDARWSGWLDLLLAAAAVLSCGFIVVQVEPMFRPLWLNETSLGGRIANETGLDMLFGLIGLVIVLEAARRSIGWIVPGLALAFVAQSFYCHLSYRHGLPELPGWLFPHRGQGISDLVSTTFLQSQGVFGQAMSVMFRYVFLFVLFGAFLEMSGATDFIIRFSQRVFGRSPGGPAKMAVMASGLMGSLSGSAVANAVTTGSFTIPMMKNAGFKPHDAAAVEAAAGSGGSLVPPVMGAGAYMMLEFIDPPVTFLQIVRAALLPAILYYFSLFVIVHLYARRIGSRAEPRDDVPLEPVGRYEGFVFFSALGTLIGLLLLGFSPFRSVTGALAVILVLAAFRRALAIGLLPRALALGAFALSVLGHQVYLRAATDYFELSQSVRHQFDALLESTILGMFVLILFGLIHPAWRPALTKALGSSIRNGIPLIAAAACVGIIIGVVMQSGIANDFSAAIKEVVQYNLLLALVGIMCTSIILGMGVPSVVCYLLIATIMGSLLGELGIPPLAAHLFIFYFGLMSMVTPPVALAGYAAASIAGANAMQTSLSAFRFALVGFTLPYMFVYQPALLLLNAEGESAGWVDLPRVALAVVVAAVGIVALAAGIVGFFKRELAIGPRLLMFLAAAALLQPNLGGAAVGAAVNAAAAVLFAAVALFNRRAPAGDNRSSASRTDRLP